MNNKEKSDITPEPETEVYPDSLIYHLEFLGEKWDEFLETFKYEISKLLGIPNIYDNKK